MGKKCDTNTYPNEQEYLDHILDEISSDPSHPIKLDDDQRQVVIGDSKYSLVVAGAGAGKTTTIQAKVKYLVERKQVDPKKILIVSFTRKTVEELRKKINELMGIPCRVSTFHSIGYSIIKKFEKKDFCGLLEGEMEQIVAKYLREEVLTNDVMISQIVTFFDQYIDAPYEGDELVAYFKRMRRDDLHTFEKEVESSPGGKAKIIKCLEKNRATLRGETVRSSQEAAIANFLYMNGVDYQYEWPYHYLDKYRKKMTVDTKYHPDFTLHVTNEKETEMEPRIVYLEHFGISQSGTNRVYDENQIEQYKNVIEKKIERHKRCGTELIYTYSQYDDNRHFLEHLEEELKKKDIPLIPRSDKEVYERLAKAEESIYLEELSNLICRFLNNFETNHYDDENFKEFLADSEKKGDQRSGLFLQICRDVYHYYRELMEQNDRIDFQDMINRADTLLEEEATDIETYQYIIVDEYQDISRQRFDLINHLAKLGNSHIVAVGDDWQSIYAFAGSDIELFTRFREMILGVDGRVNESDFVRYKIQKTHRNAQEIIDIAGQFVQKNDAQFKKNLQSEKHITDPVTIIYYDGTLKGYAGAVRKALAMIDTYNQAEENADKRVLLLGRYKSDWLSLSKSDLFQQNEGTIEALFGNRLDISCRTVHSSKGLESANVIILNGKHHKFGFPSQIMDDPVLSYVINQDDSYEYAEERRLFYVALTRTQKRVFLIADQNNPSVFVEEIKDYPGVKTC